MIPDIENFLPVAIFKMAATVPQKCGGHFENGDR
jgi:hypothetical protein